jgi:hypothetical protein
MLLGLLMIAGIGIIGLFGGMMKSETYGSRLEEYISSRNPCDIADVERLTTQYERKSKEGYI